MNTELLRKRVRQSGLTQKELAKKSGVSRTTIQNIMSGRTNPRHDVTTLLVATLELSNEDIIAIFFKNYRVPVEGQPPVIT